MERTKKQAFWALPMGLWMTLLYAIPLCIIIYTSFTHQSGPGFTLDNYREFFATPLYFRALLDSLWLSLRVVAIAFCIAFPTSYILCFVVPEKARLLLLIVMIVPFWTNYLVRAYSWFSILGSNGILSNLLFKLGIIKLPLDILYTDLTSVIGLVHYITPMLIMLIFNTMESIGTNMIEAANDLGASRMQTILHVIFPLSSGGIMGGVIYVFIMSFADYITPTTLGGQSTVVFPQLVVDFVQWTINWPLASVLAIVMTLAVAVVIAALMSIRIAGSHREDGGSGK